MEVAIACSGVTKRFGSVTALDGLDLTVSPGTVVGYLGPNGAGKSTTIRILLDLARPDEGDVRVLGQDPKGAVDLRRRIGYLPGELRLDDRLRVDETLELWASLKGGVDRSEIDGLCERLNLDAARATRGLSTGNRRKVGLVGAFMGRPELLVLDEPTSGVDPLVQVEVIDLIGDARAEGSTVFLSSHILSDVERVADEVVVLRRGQVVAAGDIDELRATARRPVVVTFGRAVPDAELRGVRGLSGVEVRGQEVRAVLEGDPNELLAVLARHDVVHLVLPEPDLEHAFLHYYEDRA